MIRNRLKRIGRPSSAVDLSNADSAAPAGVTRSDIYAAYHRYLAREPESEAAIGEHLHFANVSELIAAVTSSPEYKAKVALDDRSVRPRAQISLDQLDEVALAFQQGVGRERYGDAVLALPEWFDAALDPDEPAYLEQMLRLWESITGRTDYAPEQHEDTPEIGDQDAIYRPAFYMTGDAHIAGGQLMALGHILLRSGVTADSRVLEYGSGFGQTALAFARLGAKVDTVDINPAYCAAIAAMAEHFRVDLTPHVGSFAFNPSNADYMYDLIFFYESFHHCLDFPGLIAKLKTLVRPGGRVLLAGEPISRGPSAEIPYPWGFRLDWENAAVMRIRGWMELGFQRDYLVKAFAEAGFAWRFHQDANSLWANIYEFTPL